MIYNCILNQKEKFRIAEQSILNLTFKDRTCVLPLRYNFYTLLHGISYEKFCKWYQRKKIFEEQEFLEAIKQPIIIHFVGDYFNRPWFKNNVCRYKDEYMEYYLHSPWSEEELESVSQNISLLFRIYFKILIFLRKHHYDTFYFRFRYMFIQWLREKIPNFDKKIKRTND